MLPLVEMTEQSPLDNEADERNPNRRQSQGDEKAHCPAAGKGGHGVHQERPDHVQRTVGDIGYPKHAEDQAQTG